MSGKYDDIIDLPHPTSKKHPRMSRQNRAAQFSPFAALTGYDAAIQETERNTEKKRILSEDAIAEINENLQLIQEKKNEHPYVHITYFEKDIKKEGGKYQTIIGQYKHIDERKNILITIDGNEIPIEDISSIYLYEIDMK